MAISSEGFHPARRTGFFSLRFPTFGRYFGNLGWPILLKELRADFRKNRFFVTHGLCVAGMALGVLFSIWHLRESQSDITSVQMGRELFNLFFILQYLIVVIVFPAMTATAFTEEHANRSMALLLTTDLRPGEIVWGKFFATSTYCLITLLSTIPLLAVSTLFGGVKMEEVFFAYLILIGHTVILSMLGVFVSSRSTSALRSSLTVYGVVFAVIATLAWYLSEEGYDAYRAESDRVAGLTVVGFIIDRQGDSAVALAGRWIVWASFLFGYLFLFTANRMRTSTDDHSSYLKILTAVLLVDYLLAGFLDTSSRTLRELEALFAWRLPIAYVILFLAALFFPTESPRLSGRILHRLSQLRGRARLQRMFTPGAFWGLAFVVALILISTVALYMNVEQLVSKAAESGASGEELALLRDRTIDRVLIFPLYLVAFAALGFYLANAGFSRVYARLTAFFVFVITALLPVIFSVNRVPDGLFSLYYLSPITLWQSVEPADPIFGDDGPSFVVFGFRVVDFAQVFFICVAATLSYWGAHLARRQGLSLVRLPKKA